MLRRKLRRIHLRQLLGRLFGGPRLETIERTNSLSAFLSTDEDALHKERTKRKTRDIALPSDNLLSSVIPRIRPKVRALLYFRRLYEDLVLHGTSHGLLNRHGRYCAALAHTWESKQAKEASTGVSESKLCTPFHPDSPLKKAWNGLVLCLLVVTIVYVPMEISFLDGQSSPAMENFMLAADCVFLSDIAITFNTAYHNRRRLVVNRKQIACNYLRGMLFFDLLASFPLDFFSFSVKSKSLLRYIRVFRLLRLFRATRFQAIMKRLTGSNEQTGHRVAVAISRLSGAFMLLLLFTHFVACLWHLVELNDYQRATLLSSLSLYQRYLRSLYWAITVLATVGYGDITADTEQEEVLACSWILVGVLFFSFFLSTMSSVFTGLDLKGGVVREKVSLMEVFCKDLRVSDKVKSTVIGELRSALYHNSLESDQKYSLLTNLSKALRTQLTLSIHRQAVSRVLFFQRQDPSFLSTIVPLLEYRRYPPGMVLYERGTYADEVYFMGKGRVSFVVGPLRVPIRTMGEGGIVGETEVLEERPREYTAICREETEVFALNRKLLTVISDDFPQVAEQLAYIAKRRKEYCRESLVRASHVLGQLEEQQAEVRVDRILLRKQIRTELEKLTTEVQYRELKGAPMRDLLYSLGTEVFTLRRSLTVLFTQALLPLWPLITRLTTTPRANSSPASR